MGELTSQQILIDLDGVVPLLQEAEQLAVTWSLRSEAEPLLGNPVDAASEVKLSDAATHGASPTSFS